MPGCGTKRIVDEDAAESSVRNSLANVREKFKTAIAKKEKVNEPLASLQSLVDRSRLSIGCKLNGPIRGKVIALYNSARQACEEEEAFLRSLLKELEDVLKLQFEMRHNAHICRGSLMQLLEQRAINTPLWIGPVDSHPPPLVGAIPAPDSSQIQVGTEVAAYVDGFDGIWMLAEVQSVSSSGRYEVKDLDDEQRSKKYYVRRNRLIPLPQWRADPLRDSHALFPLNAIVLALYPQTTCFYKGAVEHVPEKSGDDYQIAFEDSSYPTGYSPPLAVPQRYVVTFKVPRTYKRRHTREEQKED